MKLSMFALLAVLLTESVACAENWPCWRGPRGDGTSLETNLPIEWDATTGKNIVWKVPVPYGGHSSPAV